MIFLTVAVEGLSSEDLLCCTFGSYEYWLQVLRTCLGYIYGQQWGFFFVVSVLHFNA